jgi:serine/threonine protein kinase
MMVSPAEAQTSRDFFVRLADDGAPHMVSDRTRVTRLDLTSQDGLRSDSETTARNLERTEGASTGFDAAEIDDLLREIGKYECRMLLGKGGMGAVYLGFDPLIEREVAIKVLPKALSRDETATTRFLAEARAIGQLNHPNVVAIYDIGKHDDHFFIVTELARGGSVASLMKQGRIAFEDACRITLESARGLQAAHDAGIVHRDVKPDNLMLSADKQVKLVDFGLAKAIDRSQQLLITATGQILGTPMYMAPEQIEKGEIDARTDIYSLGATFCQLLTGLPPFDVDSITKVLFAHVGGPRPDPCQVDPALPPACSKIIARAMAVEPDDRYQTMSELIADVESLLEPKASESIGVEATDAHAGADDAPRVLLIEPSNLLAKLTCEMFEQAGCAPIAQVNNAEDALKHVRDQTVDVAISSRQLVGADGEQLLNSIRDSQTTDSQTTSVLCVLTSSSALREMIAESNLAAPSAYVRKQAPLDELLRAVYISTDHRYSIPPAGNQCDLAVTVLSNDGSVPAALGAWLGELHVADVSSHSLGALSNDSLQDRDLIIWIDQSPASEHEVAARLIGSEAQQMGGDETTVAIIRPEESQWRLRGVKRSSFLASCECAMNRDRLARLLTIATHAANSE